mmetsp:Transcript_101334/g.290734  ORF Transcript_101334/g.290734 Transcript_101334/m.290734 type:complete len:166 (-) Transcript_101334:112-609(-)
MTDSAPKSKRCVAKAMPSTKRRRKAAPSDAHQAEEEECDCEGLQRPFFRNFQTACQHYGFPGSHQTGSYGPKGMGIVRTYSNSTPGKDKVLAHGQIVLYRLKDDALQAQFAVNHDRKKEVRIFRKATAGVVDLGLFLVEGFVKAGPGDQVTKFGAEFVRFVKAGD